nr:hypothetical protein [Pseudomonas sp. BIGb0427]
MASDLEHTPHACPVLVTLASPGARPSERLLSLSAQRVNEDARRSRRYVCGWLSSSVTTAAFSAHLIALGHLPMAQGTQFFPVYEPLRLELLAGTLKQAEQGFWWPIQHWLFPMSSGASSVISSHPHASVVPRPLAGEVQQEVVLVSTLLATWRRALSLPLTFAPARWTGATTLPPHAAAKAHYQIHQARQLGLKSHHDIITLAMHCLLLDLRLHEHARVRALIDQAARGTASLSTLLAPLQRQQLATDCHRPEPCRSIPLSLTSQLAIATTECLVNNDQCTVCQRQGLPILPLRKAVVPRLAHESPLPDDNTRMGWRTLRAGYLYVLLDRQVWQAYQVTPDGYLRQFNPLPACGHQRDTVGR